MTVSPVMKSSSGCAAELGKMHHDPRFENASPWENLTFLNIAVALDLHSEVPSRFLQ